MQLLKDSVMNEPPYLTTLNPPQRQAVEATEGPVLVLAGAGTGKTRVLTTRLSHILLSGLAKPYNILSVTFTNKAAREMRDRVGSLIGQSAEGLWLGTFHSLCVRMLRRHADLVGLSRDFTILDDDDQNRLIKQILEAENIDPKRWPPRVVNSVIQRFKDKAQTPDKVPDTKTDFAGGKLLTIYREYQSRLKTLNSCDFGDLLLHMLTIFQNHSDVLKEYQRLFRYILVDEYQDTNVAQYLWLRLLAQEHKNICCVGDDDQSIYSWRGAEVGNILRFEKDFPGAVIIRLEQNYRSTAHILGAASGLIKKNSSRHDKTLWTDDVDPDAARVKVCGVYDGDEEARRIGDEIESAQKRGIQLKDMAILVRAGFQTRSFEERLLKMGIPYRVVGGARFYERQEIRDAIAYLRVIAQPNDGLAFERIMNVPKRGLGDAVLQSLHDLARDKSLSLHEAAWQALKGETLPVRSRNTLHTLLNDFTRWRAMAANMDHGDLTKTVLDESGYTLMWQESKDAAAPGRLENLKELVGAMEDFDSLQGFLEHVSLVMDVTENADENMISIMTLHAAKGLEFDLVFLAGWEEGIFPSQRTLDEEGMKGLEEERRLAYVGITRAKKYLWIFHAANRRIYNQWQSSIPTRFIAELPKDHIEELSDAPTLRPHFNAGYGQSYGLKGQNHFQSRSQPLTITTTAKPAPTQTKNGLRAGDRIFHEKFGYGVIKNLEGDKLNIYFDKAGHKKLMADFVKKAG